MNAYIYPIPPPQARCDTRSIFKRSTAGLYSEFSFFLTGLLAKVKESNLLYLTITGLEE